MPAEGLGEAPLQDCSEDVGEGKMKQEELFAFAPNAWVKIIKGFDRKLGDHAWELQIPGTNLSIWAYPKASGYRVVRRDDKVLGRDVGPLEAKCIIEEELRCQAFTDQHGKNLHHLAGDYRG